MALSLGSGSIGVAFLVSAGIVYEVIAKDVSSPQTVEINIHKRAPTLMKWVHIGAIEGLFFAVIAGVIDPRYRAPIWIGGFLAAAITEAEYIYAKHSGLANAGPGTETY